MGHMSTFGTMNVKMPDIIAGLAEPHGMEKGQENGVLWTKRGEKDIEQQRSGYPCHQLAYLKLSVQVFICLTFDFPTCSLMGSLRKRAGEPRCDGGRQRDASTPRGPQVGAPSQRAWGSSHRF